MNFHKVILVFFFSFTEFFTMVFSGNVFVTLVSHSSTGSCKWSPLLLSLVLAQILLAMMGRRSGRMRITGLNWSLQEWGMVSQEKKGNCHSNYDFLLAMIGWSIIRIISSSSNFKFKLQVQTSSSNFKFKLQVQTSSFFYHFFVAYIFNQGCQQEK